MDEKLINIGSDIQNICIFGFRIRREHDTTAMRPIFLRDNPQCGET
jgi:hypothetical protein